MDKIVGGLKSLPEVFGVGLFLIGYQSGFIEVMTVGTWLVAIGAIIKRRTRAEALYVGNLQLFAGYLLALFQLILVKTPIIELVDMMLITMIMFTMISCSGLFLLISDKPVNRS